jgi:cytochrome c biogenesis protein CcmG, thiol:disulfide interchange protein DsbE
MPNTPTANVRPATPHRPWLVPAGLVAAAVAVIAVAAVALSGGNNNSEPQAAPIEVSGTPLPTQPQTGDDPAAGMAAPTVGGFDLDGVAWSATRPDTPAIIMFVAHWCPACQEEVPVVAQWLRDGGGDGIHVVAVATANDKARSNYPASAWLEREQWNVPTLLDDRSDTVASAFGLPGFPYFVVVDVDGNVVGRVAGKLSADQLDRLAEAARIGL